MEGEAPTPQGRTVFLKNSALVVGALPPTVLTAGLFPPPPPQRGLRLPCSATGGARRRRFIDRTRRRRRRGRRRSRESDATSRLSLSLMTRSLPSLLVALLLPSLSFPAFAKLSNKRFSPLSSLSRESQGGLFQGRRLEQPESKDWPELKLEDRVDFGSVRMLLAEH